MTIMMNVDMMVSLYYDIFDYTKTAKLFTTITISELLINTKGSHHLKKRNFEKSFHKQGGSPFSYSYSEMVQSDPKWSNNVPNNLNI